MKAKNVVDRQVREAKIGKIRPIAPSTKHPMRKLLGLAGRAWAFIASNLEGDHMVVGKCQEIPDMLRTANNQLQGKLKYVIKDIEGCYPNMPKDAIRTSMKTVLEEMDLKGRKGVFVPRSQNRGCTWQAPRSDKGGKWIPSSVLFDIAMFSLDNAIMKLNGDLLLQKQGIPMGDPVSPGMTIVACAWMERMWLTGLSPSVRGKLMAKRFMDDILLVYADGSDWNPLARYSARHALTIRLSPSLCFPVSVISRAHRTASSAEAPFRLGCGQIRTYPDAALYHTPHRSPPPPTSPSSTALARLAPLRREQRGGGRSAARGLPISSPSPCSG